MTARTCTACHGRGQRLRGWAVCPSECRDCGGTGKKPESRAERLRHAAAAMREQNIPGRGYMDDTFLAVADLLDHAAARAESKIQHGGNVSFVWSHERDALAVANAYLLADAKADAL